MVVVDNYKTLKDSMLWINKQEIIGFDTETNGLNPNSNQILLMQVGDEIRQYVIDVYKVRTYIPEFLSTLNIPIVKKVIHNAIFDYSMLFGEYNFRLDNFVCTMLANQLLNAGRKSERHGLAPVLNKYLGIELPKEERNTFIEKAYGTPFTEEQLQYSANDVKYLPRLYNIINNLIKLRDLSEVAKIEFETAKVTAEMKVKGIYVDQVKWKKLAKKAFKDSQPVKKEVEEFFSPYCEKDMFGDLVYVSPTAKTKNKKLTYFNINSPDQVKNLLEKLLKHSLDSTNSDYLKEFDHPAIDALLKYRQYNKLFTTYGEEFIKNNIDPITNRVHTDFFQLGTDSGRFSSREPNLQNIPAVQEYRDPFCVSDPQRRIISADFSAQELALIAQITQEPEFINALKTGKDVHCYSSSILNKIPYEKFFDYDDKGEIIRRNKEMDDKYRNPVKKTTFGLVYGMGPKKLSKELGISMSEAKNVIKNYFGIFSKIKNSLMSFEEALYKNKYAFSPLDKRRRDFSNIDWDDNRLVAHAVNAAKNLPFQGAGATITKLAMCKIRNEFIRRNYDAFIILTIHDEVLVECHKDIAEDCAKIIEIKMIEAFNYFAPDIPMTVKPQIGTHWIH